jgi:hypothetical protein
MVAMGVSEVTPQKCSVGPRIGKDRIVISGHSDLRSG